jgi:hypothetical protein
MKDINIPPMLDGNIRSHWMTIRSCELFVDVLERMADSSQDRRPATTRHDHAGAHA